ncbi:MAG: DUF3486 family protein [Parvibaculum sedimenti]|uniref:DUF3486 family protein n=1 Tax=Parvibaculum sedimenti TaxID=2608632 RepID=UPI003BB606DB
MGRLSKIDRLPSELKELIGRLRDQGRSIDDILTKLQELEPDLDVSRSGLGRHVQKIDAIGSRLRESRAIAEAVIAKLGENPDNRTARLNIELMHSNLMSLLAAQDDDGEAIQLDAKEAMFLAGAIKDLASAAKTDQDRELKIRQEVAKEAAKIADKVIGAAGISAEFREKAKADILGIARK